MDSLTLSNSLAIAIAMPLMTPKVFSQALGIEHSVFQAQCNRGYWPTVKIGKRIFINVEAVRLMAAKKYNELPR